MSIRPHDCIDIRVVEETLTNVGNAAALARHHLADNMDLALTAAWHRQVAMVSAERLWLVGRAAQ
jgi:hypothetical protein